ncbi:hypothetical protein K523DRAFT_323512 [Schizophyllum commune Tattone D]|nr:hypothetical protein K523DRAFT_323512 [Schizophyllum commune Tattone D]
MASNPGANGAEPSTKRAAPARTSRQPHSHSHRPCKVRQQTPSACSSDEEDL